MLKPTSFISHVSKYNNKGQEKLSKHMCGFGVQEEWRRGKRSAIFYLDVDTIKYQELMFNTVHLDCITSYTIDYDVGNSDFNNTTQ